MVPRKRACDCLTLNPLLSGTLDPNFVDWQAKDWIKAYGGDLHKKRADVLRHFKKDPANLAIAWEQYRSEQHHRYSNATLRMHNGLKIQAEEQQQLLAHSRAITEALPEEINPIAVGQNEQWQGNRSQTALPAKVVAFPSREAIAENAALTSQDKSAPDSSISFSSIPSSVNTQQSTVNNKQAGLIMYDCSLMTEKPSVPINSNGESRKPRCLQRTSVKRQAAFRD